MVRFKVTGEGSLSYMVGFWVWSFIVWAAWVFSVVIPYGEKFLNVLQTQLNADKWELKSLVIPIFWIIGYWFICEVLRFVVGLVLINIYKSKHF